METARTDKGFLGFPLDIRGLNLRGRQWQLFFPGDYEQIPRRRTLRLPRSPKSPYPIGHRVLRGINRGPDSVAFHERPHITALHHATVADKQHVTVTYDSLHAHRVSHISMQIEGEICMHIHIAIHIPPGGRALLDDAAGGMSRAGSAPHGIRGAFISFENQVAVVVRLETFKCTDPLRRPSRLRFLVFTGFQRRSASFT